MHPNTTYLPVLSNLLFVHATLWKKTKFKKKQKKNESIN